MNILYKLGWSVGYHRSVISSFVKEIFLRIILKHSNGHIEIYKEAHKSEHRNVIWQHLSKGHILHKGC